MSDEFDPAELEEMMRIEPEYDPEYQRARLGEQLAAHAWDAREGHLDEGEEIPLTEWHGFSPDPLDEEDFEWTLTFAILGEAPVQVFEVTDPDGDDVGQFPATLEDSEGLLKAFGTFAELYHLGRQVERFHAQREACELSVGDVVLLPKGKLVVRELGVDDHCEVAIYDPGYEVATVVAGEDVGQSTVKAVWDKWRMQMREKYAGTSMEEHWD